jgi:hypothetical protein
MELIPCHDRLYNDPKWVEIVHCNFHGQINHQLEKVHTYGASYIRRLEWYSCMIKLSVRCAQDQRTVRKVSVNNRWTVSESDILRTQKGSGTTSWAIENRITKNQWINIATIEIDRTRQNKPTSVDFHRIYRALNPIISETNSSTRDLHRWAGSNAQRNFINGRTARWKWAVRINSSPMAATRVRIAWAAIDNCLNCWVAGVPLICKK